MNKCLQGLQKFTKKIQHREWRTRSERESKHSVAGKEASKLNLEKKSVCITADKTLQKKVAQMGITRRTMLREVLRGGKRMQRSVKNRKG